MRSPRKTVLAVVASAVLVLATGVIAATTILDLRVPGLTAQPADHAAAAPEPAPTTTGSAAGGVEPSDAAGPSSAAASASAGTPAQAPGAPAAPPGAAPVAAAAPSPFAAAPAPAAAPGPAPTPPFEADHDDEHDDEASSPVGGTIPPPPAGCAEAEWDREHRYWKCHADEPEDD